LIPKKIKERKEKIQTPNILITGPKRVGKSFLVFNYLKDYEGKYKYIDFSDYREKSFDFEGYDLAIYENYDLSAPLPQIPVIVTSQKNIELEGFEKIELYGLDFEEYFSFFAQNENQAFDRFLREGNFPRSFSEDFFKEEYLKESFELLPYNKEVLKFFFSHIGEKFTLYQIYQILKKQIKISKDSFYKEVAEMIKDRVIFEVGKYNSPKSPKKFFAYNFAYKNILTNKKNIQYTFENIVFLELKRELYYKDGLTFYIPEEQKGILVLPFADIDTAKEKLKKVSEVKKVEIITISNEFEIKHKNFEVEVIPFIRWRFAE